MLHDVLDKQMYQYVFEKGGQMMKIHKTVQNPPENMFKLGFVVTRQAPSLLFTHLAVGALHLHRSGQGDFSVAVKYYERAMKALRIELARTDVIQPTEMACLTAGTLAFFEVSQPEAPSPFPNSKAHPQVTDGTFPGTRRAQSALIRLQQTDAAPTSSCSKRMGTAEIYS